MILRHALPLYGALRSSLAWLVAPPPARDRLPARERRVAIEERVERALPRIQRVLVVWAIVTAVVVLVLVLR